ncbi:MAG: nucleotidyltransferase domain-containing protein [Candidatus Caldarchaeum sp.]
MRKCALESVRRFLEELEAAGYSVKSVVLFGSYAKDSFTEASDIDVCVVCENLPRNVWGLPDLTKLPRVRGVQPLAYTPEDFLSALRKLSPVALDIVYDGIVLRDDGFMKQAKAVYEELRAKHGLTRWKDGWKWWPTSEAQ